MAELTTLARPYARAAFEVAQTDGQLQQWLEALSNSAAVVSQEKVKILLASPSLTAMQKSSAIVEVLGKLSNPKFNNFLASLSENKRLLLLPYICELFSAMKAQYEKAAEVSVTTAFPISDAMLETLTASLTKALERDVKLTSEIDESLLGGVVIHAGDTVIDGSVKGRLAKLAEAVKA